MNGQIYVMQLIKHELQEEFDGCIRPDLEAGLCKSIEVVDRLIKGLEKNIREI